MNCDAHFWPVLSGPRFGDCPSECARTVQYLFLELQVLAVPGIGMKLCLPGGKYAEKRAVTQQRRGHARQLKSLTTSPHCAGNYDLGFMLIRRPALNGSVTGSCPKIYAYRSNLGEPQDYRLRVPGIVHNGRARQCSKENFSQS
jgi:hypothetical protein